MHGHAHVLYGVLKGMPYTSFTLCTLPLVCTAEEEGWVAPALPMELPRAVDIPAILQASVPPFFPSLCMQAIMF
jgi:hypothetical protein